jgi:hypothetical protein
MNSETTDVVFTRYLYPKEQVYHSLLIALLEKATDEALFWCYELYHSGYQEDLYLFIESLYDNFYKSTNSPVLKNCIEDLYQKWCEDPNQHHLFGSMIKNLICRPYSVNLFMENYIGVKCEQHVGDTKPAKFLRMQFSIENSNFYETIDAEPGKARFVLKKAYRFPIRKNIAVLFQSSYPDVKEEYLNHWLYYSRGCPLWQDRIEKHGGVINHEKRDIDFEDESSDAFYDLYGYEPDEQTSEIQSFSIGIGDDKTKQMNIREFAERYGAFIVKKTIRIKHKSNM